MDVVCMQETGLRGKRKGKIIKGYKRVTQNRQTGDKKGGGLEIQIKTGIRYHIWEGIEVRNDQLRIIKHERLWVILKGKEQDIAILNTYMATDKLQHEEWNIALNMLINSEIETIKRLGHEIIIAGDFNAHIKHEDGGVKEASQTTNRNGNRLINMCGKNNLEIMNANKICTGKWTRTEGDSKTVIDYILSTRKTATCIEDMVIDEGKKWDIGVDHNWLRVTVKWEPGKEQTIEEKETRWKIREDTDWGKFRTTMNEKIKKKVGKEEINKDYTWIIDTIKEVAKQIVGIKNSTNKSKEPRRIRKAIKIRKNLAKEWGENSNVIERRIKYHQYKAGRRKVASLRIQRAQKIRKKWLTKVLKEGKQGSKSFWEKRKGLKGEENEIQTLKVEGVEITEGMGIKEAIEDYVRKLGTEDRPIEHDETDESETNEKYWITEDISKKEIAKVIKKMQKGKSSGLDGIPAEFIIEGGEGLAEYLRNIFNRIMREEVVPEEWKEEKCKLLQCGN